MRRNKNLFRQIVRFSIKYVLPVVIRRLRKRKH